MSKLQRLGIIIAILAIAVCGYIAVRAIFREGNDEVLVPQLVGMQLQDASYALKKLELTVKTEKVDSSEIEGKILAQDIKPGTKVKSGKSLLLQVSNGSGRQKVPDVRYIKKDEAVKMLEECGFKVEKILYIRDSQRADGTVIAQNPSEGQQVSKGENVELLVCSGGASDGETVDIPDLRGKTKDEAFKILKDIGLLPGKVTTEASSSKEGTVISAIPNMGSRVQRGATVSLVLAVADNSANIVVAETPAATKESTVKAVKPAAKQPQKKIATAKEPEKRTVEKQTVKKTDTKKSDIKTDTPKTEIKQEAKKTENKTVLQKKEKTQQTAKTAAKTVAKTEAKPAVHPVEQPVKKQEAKQETKQETKPAEQPEPKQSISLKSAKIRYVVPPLTKQLNLQITMNDADGSHVLKDIMVKGNEVISLPVKYKEKANVSIILGGETVWHETCK